MMKLRPLVVEPNGDGKSLIVLGGNMRLEALKSLGYKDIPDDWVKLASDLTDEEKKRFIITDNSSFGEYDWEALANEWGDYPLVDWGVDLPEDWVKSEPVEEDESAVAEIIDRAAELQAKWDTKSGQLWEIPSKSAQGKSHRLLVGDATEKADVGRLCANVKASLMNTDPPYGVDLVAVKPKGVGFNVLEGNGGLENDDLTDGAALQAFLEDMIRAALPHLIENPAFYLWHPMLTQGTFFAAAAAADILIHRQIIWVKPHMVLTRSGMYHWKHELCFYGWIRGKPCDWLGDKSQVSVWELGESSQGRLHPTQKPVELFTRPIKNHTLRGDVIYEPFAGSGSQFIAAEQEGRVCYGMEIEPKYCAVTLERLSALGLSPKLVE